MQINDGTEVVLAGPVEGVVQQVPSLGQFVALLIPELHLVDGDTYKVEAQLLQTGKIILLDMQATGLTALFRLREPVADIGAALDAEVIDLSGLILILTLALVLARHCYKQCRNDNGHREDTLSHNQ